MEMSLSLIDLRRPGPAPQAHDAAGPGPAPPSPSERREAGLAEAAVSLTQTGLVGRALMGAAPPPMPSARPSAAAILGEPRRAERVLAPWGVPMLPSDAASEARRAAAREAARRGAADSGAGATRPEGVEATSPPPARGPVPRPHGGGTADQPPRDHGRDAAPLAAGAGVPSNDAPDLGRADPTTG